MGCRWSVQSYDEGKQAQANDSAKVWCKETPGYDLQVRAASFNCGEQPLPENSAQWIVPGADIYAVGLLECMHTKECFETIEKILGSGYQKIASDFIGVPQIHGFIALIILVKASVWPRVLNVEMSSEATGLAHVLPNKGAVATSFALDGSSFCFVVSHMAAHQHAVEKRDSDYQEILSGIHLGRYGKQLTDQFTHALWMGDMNYRIDLDFCQDVDYVDAGDWKALLKNDQLLKERAAGRAFCGWREAEITFPPTYKHAVGEAPDEFGIRPFSKKQVPSYCDRILWRSLPGVPFETKSGSYRSIPAITTSDHDPVCIDCTAFVQGRRPELTTDDSSTLILVLSGLQVELRVDPSEQKKLLHLDHHVPEELACEVCPDSGVLVKAISHPKDHVYRGMVGSTGASPVSFSECEQPAKTPASMCSSKWSDELIFEVVVPRDGPRLAADWLESRHVHFSLTAHANTDHPSLHRSLSKVFLQTGKSFGSGSIGLKGVTEYTDGRLFDTDLDYNGIHIAVLKGKVSIKTLTKQATPTEAETETTI